MDTHAPELLTMIPRTRFSRRGFVMTTLASGFALAWLPVSAATIITDANGLDAAEVKVPTADGEMPAYRAMPDKGGPFATVLVCHEAWGVHEHIKDICRRLAKLGYYAIAPELAARQGNLAVITDGPERGKVLASIPTEQVMSDLDATVVYAKSAGKADTAKLAVTGFCWGGFATWMYAVHQPALKAAVPWYGPDRKTSDLIPQNPGDVMAELKCPVLAFYGEKDQFIPADTGPKREEACKAAGKTCEFKILPNAQHGFNADYRDTYNADAAKDAWAMMLAWFNKYGVA